MPAVAALLWVFAAPWVLLGRWIQRLPPESAPPALFLFGVNRTNPSDGPLIGVIMFVHPKENIHVTLLRLEHDASVILINANRSQIVVLRPFDFLVVVSGGGGICRKFVKKAAHLLLLLLGKFTESCEEVGSRASLISWRALLMFTMIGLR